MTIQYQGVWSLQSAAQLQSTQRWVTDPLYKNTTLLLQADDAANAAQNNTFLDSSSNSFAITRNGGNPGMTQGSFTPFSSQPGAWSNFFGGTGSYAQTSSTIIATTTTTFTIEGWIYPTAAPVTASSIPSVIADGAPTGTALYWGFGPLANGTLSFYWYDGVAKSAVGNTVIALNTWTHIAVSVNANAITLYVNGVQQTLSGTTTLTNRNGTTGLCTFAQFNSGGSYFTGYISNFSILSGTAKYSTSFTPSPAPLPTGTTNQVLLFAYANRFVDSNTATTAKTFTITGTPSVQPFSPFAPQYQWTSSVIGGSGYFDGTGDYLSIADNDALDMEAQNFTFECWIYPVAAPAGSSQFIFTKRASTSTFGGFTVFFTNSLAPRFQATVNGSTWGVSITSTVLCNRYAWNHIAAVRSGNDWTLFVNGASGGTVNLSGTIPTNTAAVVIGAGADGGTQNIFESYIANARLVKGTAVYTGAFTPPIAPVTTSGPASSYSSTTNVNTTFTSTNTSLLTNFTNAGIVDGTMKNVLETVGNAQISTAVVKYGSGSMYFDGNGDYLRFQNGPNLNFAFGTGDFTIELWIYMNTAANQTLFDIYDGNSTGRILYQITSSRTVQLAGASGANRTTTTGTVPLTTWSHIALCKASNVTRIFIDGVQANTNYTDTNNYTCTTGVVVFGINGSDLATNPLNAYIDDLRITKGFARYTQNFIPPSVALPRQ